jgi:hypothetical protein
MLVARIRFRPTRSLSQAGGDKRPPVAIEVLRHHFHDDDIVMLHPVTADGGATIPQPVGAPMRRREFITLIGGAAVYPNLIIMLAARQKLPVVALEAKGSPNRNAIASAACHTHGIIAGATRTGVHGLKWLRCDSGTPCQNRPRLATAVSPDCPLKGARIKCNCAMPTF